MNILDSYFVKLGAVIDQTGWNKFDLTLRNADKSVLNFATTTVLNFAKIEGAIVGTLAGVGVGLISLADKTAMADQQYRLFGMRMLMTKESARAMQIATDELGASLDQIAYDPELNRRFQYLYEQNIKLGRAMGTGFDGTTRQMRDLHMAYQVLGKDLEFLEGAIITKLFQKLGMSSDDLLSKFYK